VSRDDEEPERWAQLVNVEVLVIAVTAVALLRVRRSRVHDGECAVRVNGFGFDGDGNHVDIVEVGFKALSR